MIRTILRKYLLVAIHSLLLPLQIQAQQEKTKIFRDTLEGAFDISYWLFNLHGFIPSVSVITEQQSKE